MTIKMLVFDYRDSEKNFFGTHELENFEITFYNDSLTEETIKFLPEELLDSTSVISVFVNSQVTKNVINAFKNLRIISTRSTGIDHIDKSTADEKNISVINVEAYGAKSVAQFTIGLILALVRNIIPASRFFLDGNIDCRDFIGRDLSELTLGIVGTGNIGFAVYKVAKAFGMKVLAYDLVQRQELKTNGHDIEYVDFNTLLKKSDIITLHLPYTGDNYHMFSAGQFKLMKKSAYLVNASRGELVCMKDLYEALCEGIIKGAALDVVTCEDISFRCENFAKMVNNNLKCVEETKILRDLAKLDNVIITPHIAYDTKDVIDYILNQTFIAISDIVKGGNSYRI